MSVLSLFKKDLHTNRDLLLMTTHSSLTDRAKNIGFDLVCKNVQQIKTIQDIELQIPTLPKYSCFNPSIVKTQNGYICVIRTSNYKYNDTDKIIWLDNQVNTINYVVTLDHEFKILEYRMLDNPSFVINPPNCERSIYGCEDFRIRSEFGHLKDNILMGSYTCHNQIKGVFCNIGESSYDLETNKLISAKVYLSPNNRICEKNWLPFGDKFIYQFHPLTILDSEAKVISVKTHNLDFSRFRGSCPPIKYGDDLICLIHETSKTIFKYIHRFVRMTNDYTITHISAPFTFQGDNIEYCCGMCPSNINNILVLTYGIRDTKARLCLVDIDTIEWIKI